MGVRYKQDGRAYLIAEEEVHGDVRRCRACNTRLLFIETPTSPRLPLDLDRATRLDNGWLRCVNHFATCPHAERFKRDRPKGKGACPVRGCTGRAREGSLMCPDCWKRVPKRQRDEVVSTWKSVQKGGRPQWKAYEQAGASAIATVEASRAAEKVHQLEAFGDRGADPG